MIDVISIRSACHKQRYSGMKTHDRHREGRCPVQVLLALPTLFDFVHALRLPLEPHTHCDRSARSGTFSADALASRSGQDGLVVFVSALAFARGGYSWRVGESSNKPILMWTHAREGKRRPLFQRLV